MTQYFIFKAVVARRFPPLKEAKQEMSNVETHVLRVRGRRGCVDLEAPDGFLVPGLGEFDDSVLHFQGCCCAALPAS
jgi:hypothetical protein